MYRHYTDDTVLTHRYLSIEIRYCFELDDGLGFPRLSVPTWKQLLTRIGLQQAQLAGAGYCFGPSLNLQLVKDDPGMPFNGAQG